MSTFIIYIFSGDVDEQHYAWYAMQGEGNTNKKVAAKIAWKQYTSDHNVEDPEEWTVTVTTVDVTTGALLSIGNFNTGWLDVPHQTFGGDTL